MELFIAIGHILGSILVLIVIGFIMSLIASWETYQYRRQKLQEVSIKLGISMEDLDKEEHSPKLLQLSSELYSSELLRNRISDFCGVIRMLWDWLGFLVTVAVLIGVVWYTVSDSIETAVFAWFIVVIAVFFWITSMIFSLICRLLTGRYPGQAKHVRKSIAAFLKNRTDETI